MQELKTELKKIPVTALLLLANICVFLITDITGGTEDTLHMLDCGAMYAPLVLENKEVYRLLTSMFLHFGMEHLANNMLVLFILGQRLEPLTGKLRYLLIYFAGGLGGNLISLCAEMIHPENAVSAGASGAVFGVMGAMLYALLRGRGRVQDLSARQILVMAAFSLYFGFASGGVDNAAHLGGMICGFMTAILVYHPRKV